MGSKAGWMFGIKKEKSFVPAWHRAPDVLVSVSTEPSRPQDLDNAGILCGLYHFPSSAHSYSAPSPGYSVQCILWYPMQGCWRAASISCPFASFCFPVLSMPTAGFV